MMRKMDWKLSALQIVSILSTICIVLSILLLYHHLSDDYFIPPLEYLSSIKLAAPPIFVLISTYALTFLLGEKVSDAPKLTIGFVRNTFLQNSRWMATYVVILTAINLSIFYYVQTTAPPHYINLVAKLLGGEQDEQKPITMEIKAISEKNVEFSKELTIIVDVFSLRSKWNFSHKQPNTSEPRILARALEANLTSADWIESPLRKHALAEAYSIWAQTAKSSKYSIESNDWKNLRDKSVALYEEVANSDSPLATPLLKSSALNNAGNVFLYTGDLSNAVNYYNRVLKTNINLSTAGNLVAALIMQSKYKEAALKGDEYIAWGRKSGKALTEGSSYSSVVLNTGFSHLIQGNYTEGVKLMLEAYDFTSDDLNALNLAVALKLAKMDDESEDLLARHFKYVKLDVNSQSSRVREKYNPCYYFVSSAIERHPDAASKAANIYMYLGEAKSPQQLSAITNSSLTGLIKKASMFAENDPASCKDFLLIPEFKKLLYTTSDYQQNIVSSH